MQCMPGTGVCGKWVGKARRLVRECVDFDVAFRYDAGLWRREYLRRLDEESTVSDDFVQRRFPPC